MDDSLCACCEDCGTEAHRDQWLNKDCCGLVCAGVTWGLLVFAEYAMVDVLITPWYGTSLFGMIHIGAFTAIVCLAIMSHVRAMTTDPGAVPKNAVPLDFEPGDKGASYTVCLKCDSYKPSKAHHCSICKRCITKLDHHCPWVNNCVGLGNHKFFLLFLFYVNLAAIYALTFLGMHMVHCTGRGDSGRRRRNRLRGRSRPEIDVAQEVVESSIDAIAQATQSPSFPECNLSTGSNIIMFVLLIEGILFGLFTLCMMCDQWSVVLTSVTKIDKLKGGKATSKRSICDNLTEVFGGEPRFSLHWLLPTTVKWTHRDLVYGFRVHDEQELAALTSETIIDHSPVPENTAPSASDDIVVSIG